MEKHSVNISGLRGTVAAHRPPAGAKDSFPKDDGPVGCFVGLLRDTSKHWCVADTIDGLLKQAMDNIPTDYDEDTWKDANLVCIEDGDRIPDMDALRSCITTKKHTEFYFIGPNAPTYEEISLDIEWVAELYKELQESEDVSLKIHKWVYLRMRDLEAILFAACDLLALKVGHSSAKVDAFQERIGKFLISSRGTPYYRPFS